MNSSFVEQGSDILTGVVACEEAAESFIGLVFRELRE